MRRAVTTLLVLSLTVPCAAADPEATGPASDAALADGARVRLKLSRGVRDLPNPVVGRIASIDGETITVSLNSLQRVTVPARAVERVEVSAGRHSRGRGAAVGFGVGALAGALFFGLASAPGCREEFPSSPGGCTVTVTTIGAVLVAVPGALIGVMVPPGERWKTVSRERLRVTAQPILRKDGAGIGLAVSF